MNAKQIVASVVVAAAWVGALAFMPANADSIEASAPAFVASATPLNATETPQVLTWDMTYGDMQPPVIVADAGPVEAAQDEVVDLSMG